MSHATGETLYHFRANTKSVFEREAPNTTQLAAYRDGVLVAPISASYTLFAPEHSLDGSLWVVTTAAVPNVDSIATYTIQTDKLPSTLALGSGYTEVWSLSMPDGRTYKVRRPVVVGLFQLFPPITEADLVQGEYPDLVVSLGADGSTTLQGLMDGAWHACIRHLERHGRWPDVVFDSSDVFDWHRHETLKRCFGAMLQRQAGNERWRELFIEHRDEAKSAKSGLRISEDRDRDGKADSHGKSAVSRPVVPNIPPRRHFRRGVNPKFG